MEDKKTFVDESAYTMAEALSKAEALSNYCRKHKNCADCVFTREKEKQSFEGVRCMLHRASPDQWFSPK